MYEKVIKCLLYVCSTYAAPRLTRDLDKPASRPCTDHSPTQPNNMLFVGVHHTP